VVILKGHRKVLPAATWFSHQAVLLLAFSIAGSAAADAPVCPVLPAVNVPERESPSDDDEDWEPRVGRPQWLYLNDTNFPQESKSNGLWVQAEESLANGDLECARAAATRIDEISSARGGGSDFHRVVRANNNAILRLASGDAATAASELEATLNTLQGLRIPTPWMFMAREFEKAILANLGLAHWVRGNSAEALNFFKQVLSKRDSRTVLGLNDQTRLRLAKFAADELNVLATLERDTTPSDDAAGLTALFQLKGALLDRQVRGTSSARESSSHLPTAKRAVTAHQGISILREVGSAVVDVGSTLGGGVAGKALGGFASDAIRPDASSVAELARRQDVVRQGQQDTELLLHREQLQTKRSRLAHGQVATDMESAQRNSETALVESELQTIESSFANRGELPATVAQVRASVLQSAALVEMLKYRPASPEFGPRARRTPSSFRYAAYVVKRDAPTIFVDLGAVEPTDRLVKELRSQLTRPSTTGRARDIGHELYLRVMKPLSPALGDATTILLAPEGQLNLVPYGALVDDDGRFLIERYGLNYVVSGRDLLRQNDALRPRGPALIVANPNFALKHAGISPATAGVAVSQRSVDFSNMEFSELPGTAAEAAAIRSLLPGSRVLVGNDATESAVKAARGPIVLHLATHGFFLGTHESGDRSSGADWRSDHQTEDPLLRSALLFAGVKALRSGQDDGVLTALEASGLDLRGTKLVVLSACETGIGEVKTGEGVFGLRRAFVVAGAETLVMSLWAVEDAATQRLMVNYYLRLSEGHGRVEALRLAQRAMLADPKLGHPFYWAAFIASGDDGRISN